MAKSCKTVRADTDLEQILRWWVCRALSHRDVGQRLSSPTDFQQLQDLKMFAEQAKPVGLSWKFKRL